MLAWYRDRFDTVELNNSFYRLPSETALEAWRAATPANFCFAVKGSRLLTHMKKLKDPSPGLDKFFSRIDLLKEKLGPILFQLPPNFEVNVLRLEGFLDALPNWHRYAFEFRSESWNTSEVFHLLRRRNISPTARFTSLAINLRLRSRRTSRTFAYTAPEASISAVTTMKAWGTGRGESRHGVAI